MIVLLKNNMTTILGKRKQPRREIPWIGTLMETLLETSYEWNYGDSLLSLRRVTVP